MNAAPPRRCLVTGASGAVGGALVEELLIAGWRVRCLLRDAHGAPALDPGVEIVEGDITDSQAVAAATRDIDVVFHLAALLHRTDRSPGLAQKYFMVNVEGTKNVVRAAAAANVERVVLFSTIAVYPASPGGMADESTPVAPVTPYAQSKVAAEQIALGATNRRSEGLSTVLRLAAVYGPHVKANYRRLVDAIGHRRFIPVGRGDNRRTLVHEADVARAAMLAASSVAAAGRIYNVTDGAVHTVHEITEAIYAAFGRRPPHVSMPVWPIRVAARAAAAVLGSRSPITPLTIEKYLEDVAVSGRRLQRELGFVPRFDLKSGWDDTVAKLKSAGAFR